MDRLKNALAIGIVLLCGPFYHMWNYHFRNGNCQSLFPKQNRCSPECSPLMAQIDDVRTIMINLRQPKDDAHSYSSFQIQSREKAFYINRGILIRQYLLKFIISAASRDYLWKISSSKKNHWIAKIGCIRICELCFAFIKHFGPWENVIGTVDQANE